MAWYLSLFSKIYESPLGAKILFAIEEATKNSNFQGAFLCYLAIQKFERISMSQRQDNQELEQSLNEVLKLLESIGNPLSAEDLDNLSKIFADNGYENIK